MAQAKTGDKARVHYSGFLEDGSTFDSSLEREPLEFTLGQGMVIPGFEDAVIGMNEGESKTTSIHQENAYGSHKKDLVVILERSQVSPDIDQKVGMQLQLRSPEGTTTDVIITDLTEDTITIDANHPLAGKNLVFEIKLLEILKAV